MRSIASALADGNRAAILLAEICIIAKIANVRKLS